MRYYYPSTVSLEDHAEDDSVGASDIDSVEGDLNSGYILSTLSGDQRWVASLLSQGFGRTEIATALALPVVMVHKIVLGIKLKLAPHYTSSINKRERNFYQNIILLFLFSAPSATPETIEMMWNTHPVLREYKKPNKYLICEWYNLIIKSFYLRKKVSL